MLTSSFCASRLLDATPRMSATELVLRSSIAAATPSQQHYNLALKWSSHRHVPPRGASGRDAVHHQHLEEERELLLPRSISFVAAASAPPQQQQQATAVSREDERSTFFSESVDR